MNTNYGCFWRWKSASFALFAYLDLCLPAFNKRYTKVLYFCIACEAFTTYTQIFRSGNQSWRLSSMGFFPGPLLKTELYCWGTMVIARWAWTTDLRAAYRVERNSSYFSLKLHLKTRKQAIFLTLLILYQRHKKTSVLF